MWPSTWNVFIWVYQLHQQVSSPLLISGLWAFQHLQSTHILFLLLFPIVPTNKRNNPSLFFTGPLNFMAPKPDFWSSPNQAIPSYTSAYSSYISVLHLNLGKSRTNTARKRCKTWFWEVSKNKLGSAVVALLSAPYFCSGAYLSFAINMRHGQFLQESK